MGFEPTRAEPSDLRDHRVYQFRHTSTRLTILAIPKAKDAEIRHALPPRPGTLGVKRSTETIKRALAGTREREVARAFFGLCLRSGDR